MGSRLNTKQKERLYSLFTYASSAGVAAYGIFYANFDRAEINGRPIPEDVRQDHIFTAVSGWVYFVSLH